MLTLPTDIQFDAQGLVAVVAQHALTGEVRMVAYANQAALDATAQTGLAHFYSRSRNALWRKGEESGNTMQVLAVQKDCDGDAVLYSVVPRGPTCHTGTESCFNSQAESMRVPFLLALESALRERATAHEEKSYTRSLLSAGTVRIGEKLEEEARELATALHEESDPRVIAESADVLYHMMVGLLARSLAFEQVIGELQRRFGVSGHVEKASRAKLS